MRAMRYLLVALALLIPAGTPASADDNNVDLLLVLAADVSRSVDYPKFKLQREGYASAATNPQVLNAITSGVNGRIAVTFVEWAGYGQQEIVVDWTLIDGPEAAGQFSEQVLKAPRSFADRTSISEAIDFSVGLFAQAPYKSPRRTIDISGDGTNNSGPSVQMARDAAVAQGITINGLVILTPAPEAWNAYHTNPPGGLEEYYRQSVIGGPGAFVVAAEDFNSFGQAIVKKLIAEIASLDAQHAR